MPRFGGWLGSRSGSTQRPTQRGSTQSLTALEEPQHLEQALRGALHIMNDDAETAESQLARGNSAFHKLGRGTISFLRAALGFEHDVMREASDRLYDAESSASEHYRRAQRQSKASLSDIYAPGTEYAVCQAEAQIMSAVIGVLTESLTESLKGFYKVRKASSSLHAILQKEEKYLSSRSQPSAEPASPTSPTSPSFGSPRSYAHDVAAARRPSGSPIVDQLYSSIRGSLVLKRQGEFEDSGLEFHDANDFRLGRTDNYLGHIESHTLSIQDDGDASDRSDEPPSLATDKSSETSRRGSTALQQQPWDGKSDPAVFSGNPIDEFIHSGANLHYGILLMVLSLIPPVFGKLLSIIGFHGDREQGLTMLWRATHFDNIHGALACLILLSYYNGLMTFMDVLPPRSNEYPRERLSAILQDMRQRFPASGLWRAEEARALGANRHLVDAVAVVKDADESPMKQVAALECFDHSLNCLYLGAWAESAEASLRCVGLNSWSHALYHYNAAIAHVELYREAKYARADAAAAATHAKRAEELIAKIPAETGKKKLLGKQLPFDVYVGRKLAKWRARASEWKVPLVDAVGVSPGSEMTLFWGGFARMDDGQLREALARLAWTDAGDADAEGDETSDLLSGDELCAPAKGKNPNWSRESVDEAGALAVLRATILRHLGHTARAKRLLRRHVLVDVAGDQHGGSGSGSDKKHSLHHGNIDAEFRGAQRENWVPPIARYELGVCYWAESDDGQASEAERRGLPLEEVLRRGERDDQGSNAEALKLCGAWIERAAAWESYDLDNRMGMKISTARQTLKGLGYGH